MTSDATAARLRERGERLTPQRLMVLDALREGPGHLTADDVFQHVAARYPYVNQATVYRALLWLQEQGLVSAADLGGGRMEYEYLHEERHHHLVCLQCHGRIELADELVAPLAAAIQARYGFVPRVDHLAIFGLCRACQEHEADTHAVEG